MKKIGTLNSHLSRVIAQMGHSDRLVICDCGFPIPRDADIVDLALVKNIPRFIDTLIVVLEELQVESVVIAKELESTNKHAHRDLMQVLDAARISSVKAVAHEEFKRMTTNGKNIAFVRTGEATPYANIILVGGVTFD